jgi:hypothetical protein
MKTQYCIHWLKAGRLASVELMTKPMTKAQAEAIAKYQLKMNVGKYDSFIVKPA